MKILIIGGTFDNDGGKPSGLVSKIIDAIQNINGLVAYRNGGNYDDLKHTLENCVKDYDVVFWWPNVPNDLPKIRDVKEIAPHVMLVTSKRNDGHKYNFQELINHSLDVKANLTFEFSKENDNLFNIMIFDPLGTMWYKGNDVNQAALAALKRLQFLMSITRQKSYQSAEGAGLVLSWYFDRYKEEMYVSDKAIAVPAELQFVERVKQYAERFQEIMKPAKEVTRFLGNASMRPTPPQIGRCGKGMPSFRKDGYIFVSQRNIDKQFISIENFVPTYMEDGKVYYCGDKKPSVDTPIQLRLYDALPNINYMIHSHCYIKDAPFTSQAIPCGAIEEATEILRLIDTTHSRTHIRYTINLIGHGSILMSQDIEGLDGVEYYGRMMPEDITNMR